MTDSMAVACEEADERAAKAAEMTPTEVAYARMLAAWVEWPGRDTSEMGDSLRYVGDMLRADGLTLGDDASLSGQALLDRARKAGVLWSTPRGDQ